MDRLTCFYQLFFLQLLLLCVQGCAKLCSHDQSFALLQFEQLFSLKQDPYNGCDGYQQYYPKTKYWEKTKDCCSWDGVTCDIATGHVIGLDLSCSWLQGNIPSNNSLFLLPHLQKLNLAYNNFNSSQISPSFGKLDGLTHLNLSSSNFSGQLPYQFSHLSKLVSLDLSYNRDVKIETPVWIKLANNLTNLKELDLLGLNLSAVEPSYLTNLTSSLSSLTLRSCELQGRLPENFFCTPNLQNIRVLDLSFNKLKGSIPSSIANLTQLSILGLSGNRLTGEIPLSIGNLTQLSNLELSRNRLIGEIPSCLSRLRNLISIDLSYNSLNGTISSWLSTDLSTLERVYIYNNQLTGSIPSSMFELANLTLLDLSSNNLSGTIELHMFAKLKNLNRLSLSRNRLSLNTTITVNSSFSNLSRLMLSNCNITEFPYMLRSQHQLEILDLSENKIHGDAPNWMSDMAKDTLIHLNLSHNFLTGFIEQLRWKNLEYLDLSFNWLQGSLMALPPSVRLFSVKNNTLIGEIPSSFCNLSSIFFLDLSNNKLSGIIPKNLGNSDLHVQNNSLYKSNPQFFAIITLVLNGNQLEGPLPPSLVNCRWLEVLDVGNNRINDTFPYWLEDLPQLQVLVLRSNKFYGPITNSNATFSFPKLRILDLSHNEFTGVFPTRYFQNFKGMMDVKKDFWLLLASPYDIPEYGEYSALLTLKGYDREMKSTYMLLTFTAIDLSSNHFEGGIPEIVGSLHSLQGLNFSHNNFTGPIPSSLGNLANLESLDLSSNKLVGKIPQELTRLDFLQVLNLSENQLVGPIPRVRHFDTFLNDSYIGNKGLCGLPLTETCRNDEGPDPGPTIFHEEDDTSSLFDWKMATMGYGTGLVIGLSLGYTVFETGRPRWLVHMIERKQSKKVQRLIRQGRGRRIN